MEQRTTSLPSTEAGATVAAICDWLALVLIAVTALVAVASFRDYGVGWDDFTHAEYGDLLLELYASGFTDKRALSFVNLYMYGGGFDLLAALAAKVLPFTLFETRRLLGAVVGLIGQVVVWRTARRVGGPVAGLIGLALLASCPLFVGHQLINAKDGPFAVAMAVLLLGLVCAFDQYPRPCAGTVALTGAGFGLAIGSRIMGGFGVISALAALALLVTIDTRQEGARSAATRLGQFVLRVLPGILLTLVVMALIWPWVVSAPLNLLQAIDYFSRFFEEPWQELFGGTLIRVIDMPRSYVPTLLALQLPEL